MNDLAIKSPLPATTRSVFTGTPEQILTEIMSTYQRQLTAHISARLGFRDRQLAEDLTQESFLRLWRFYIAPGVAVDERVYALLTVIARQTISQHYLRRRNHETATDFTNATVTLGRTLAAPPTDAPHLARLYDELEQAKDTLVPLAETYRVARRIQNTAHLAASVAQLPETIERWAKRVEAADAAAAGAVEALRAAAEVAADCRRAFDQAATVLGNQGGSDPDANELLRRVRIGGRR